MAVKPRKVVGKEVHSALPARLLVDDARGYINFFKDCEGGNPVSALSRWQLATILAKMLRPPIRNVTINIPVPFPFNNKHSLLTPSQC